MRARWTSTIGLIALTCACAGPVEPAAAPAGREATGVAEASTDPEASKDPEAATVSAGPAVPPVPGIEAEAVRLRTDEAIGGQVQVRITATGSEPFTVTSVALDSPGFEPLLARATRADFAPGRTIDLPAPYGEPRCEVAAEPAAARITVVRPDGGTEELRAPLAAEILTRIHEEACAVRALLEVVDVQIADPTDEDDAVSGEIRLTRRSGNEPVTVARLDRSVLVDVDAPDLPVRMAADQESVSTPVRFTSATCEPHVLAETKKPYVFPFEVTVGNGEPVVLDLPVDDALRARLAALVDRVCLGR